jgi:hypothetical protein
MSRQVREDGWWSENGGMTWHHPAPDASAPMVSSGYRTVTIGSRIPVAIPNPIEQHLTAIREHYTALDQQHGVTAVTIAKLQSDIEILNARLVEYKKRYEDAEAKIEKIKEHL